MRIPNQVPAKRAARTSSSNPFKWAKTNFPTKPAANGKHAHEIENPLTKLSTNRQTQIL